MPNITSVRAVRRPPFECAARSSGPRYASTSISRPQRRRPSDSRTRSLSSRSRATTRVSRSKKAVSKIATSPFMGQSAGAGSASWTGWSGRWPEGPEGPRVPSVAGSLDRGFAKPLLDRVAAPLVHVESLVGGLIHGLPVEALPPCGDSDAELDGNRQLRGAVQVIKRLADAKADLAGVSLVGVRHRHAELVAAQPAARIGGPHRPLQLSREDADRFVADVVAVGVVDVLEVVEVDHHQREAALVPFGRCDRAVDRPLELRPVGQPGQVVGARLLGVLTRAVESDGDLVRNRCD